MKPKRNAKNIGRIVDGLIRKWQTGSKERGKAIGDAWKAATNEETRSKTQLVSYKNGTLTVIVVDSPWLYKLTLEKRGIVEKFNQNYKGKKKAQDIRFRVGVLGAE
ncbi:MAG: DUF721 domain-containing protein [Candidatus Omnitrophota bacterium]